PFSKWSMKDELSPLLKQAKEQVNPVRVVCSLRDVIMTQPLGEGARERRMNKIRRLIARYYDAVLIHSDPTFQRLDDCFSHANRLQCEIVYTGYVAQKWSTEKRFKQGYVEQAEIEKAIAVSSPESSAAAMSMPTRTLEFSHLSTQASPSPSIVVSAGGGRHGYPLLSAVIAASGLIREIWPHKLHMFAGPFMPEEAFLKLQQSAASRPNVVLRRYTANLLDYLNQADLSINLGGYNTTMNLLMTGVRSLLLPSMNPSQTDEQRIRAEKLAELGLVTLLTPEDLVPDRLVDAIALSLTNLPTPHHLDLNGAENTASYLRELLIEQPVVEQPALMPVGSEI
ncbi:MAG: glycosyltransferase, partial [Cyanobacteria bacterium J06650_10]